MASTVKTFRKKANGLFSFDVDCVKRSSNGILDTKGSIYWLEPLDFLPMATDLRSFDFAEEL